ncbi:helix-turn-helix transcriptional regulator [Herbiconiux daphne]|uniref:Helix-turn-helix transcriptional regulator n=1 Tax=Herbiconiux daphne TaxID=2970914 RepID=A0ABT2GZL1_9MICO|nr:helix-turn-helix transcriptional regulator [Herbiconiux daphne]MCS5733399.1 helix-turn-helix transcriptional regulator [Herbiconiux daphne]
MRETGDIRRAVGGDLRWSERSSAVAALSRGIGVIVVGAPGSGRTRFVRDVMASLDEATRATIWVGEDLHLFGERQALGLAQSISSRQVVPLATATTHRPISAALSALWRDGVVVRIELTPIPATALKLVAEEFLGAPLDPDAVPAFVPRRAGSDLAALYESLDAAKKSLALARRSGTWQLHGPVPPSESLRQLLHGHAGAGADAATTAALLDLLGLVPGLTLQCALTLGDHLHLASPVDAELERLEEFGVITTRDHNGTPSLRLRDGIVELLLPQTIATLRRRRLGAAVVEVLGAVGAAELAPGEIVAYARLAPEFGRRLDGGALTLAARASLRGADRELSVTLADAAVEAGGGFDAEMALAAAESQIGRSEAALDRLRRLVDAAQGDAQRGGALAELTRQVIERTPDAAAALSATAAIAAESGARRDALSGFMLFTLGDATGAATLVEPALGELSGEELGQAHFVVAVGAMLSGQIARAGNALDEAETTFASVGADVSRVQNMRANIAMFEGRIPEALAVMEAFRRGSIEHGQLVAEAMLSWTIGGLLVCQGRAERSVAELRPAIEAMERIGLTGTSLHARCDLATALALLGDEAAAIDALAPCLSPESSSSFGVAGRSLQAQGWIHASAGRLDDAASTFMRAADAFAAAGQNIASLTSLVDAARMGSASVVLGRIDTLALGVEGAYAGTLVRHSRALARAEVLSPLDSTGNAEVAAEFDEIGALATEISVHVIAAEAFDQASSLHRVSGAVRAAAASARLRDEQLAAYGLDRLPLLVERESQSLSRRENELARLAAEGLSNREIAARLVLSVRTVETHLQRVYQKLGVRGRSELSSALR